MEEGATGLQGTAGGTRTAWGEERQEYKAFGILFACSLEFHRTLKIIPRTLREVVNRERLCCTIAFYFTGFRKVGGCRKSGT